MSSRYFFNCLFFFLFISSSCNGALNGRIDTFESIGDGIILNDTTPYFISSTSYVNGGVIFNYPAGLFSSAPSLTVSIEENGVLYTPTQVFVAQITSNSASSTTIRVNLITTLSIAEASNDDITVHIFAIEM